MVDVFELPACQKMLIKNASLGMAGAEWIKDIEKL